ncbi:hypothetical protein HanRHA438_Chr07g0316991 [Helianthus annuus]|nr:hypothetical protein HanHA89_Chr07g0270611 [Helianthus annuus]KAJ0729438.1 hypothetical protein HanLR1_Chr07g0252931 [Helianthus annuus]KAJ0732165.1 hypothetical protein HanOQP8_Chr07g0260161 [Helianthus annuus]KAJ0905783.1 hypothetical protein HanPSC8_Chr07g0298001 [Helianthus annuus]KAJ0909024.1 hypothetical protein HanRHA438_Chr07g0316991 [Helianthus annuus]
MKSLKPNHFSFPLRCASALFFWVLVIEERFAVVSRNQDGMMSTDDRVDSVIVVGGSTKGTSQLHI